MKLRTRSPISSLRCSVNGRYSSPRARSFSMSSRSNVSGLNIIQLQAQTSGATTRNTTRLMTSSRCAAATIGAYASSSGTTDTSSHSTVFSDL